MIENDLFCLGIAFVDDAFYLAVDLARHFLAVGSRMRQVAANKDLVVVSIVVDSCPVFLTTVLGYHRARHRGRLLDILGGAGRDVVKDNLLGDRPPSETMIF